MLDTVTHLNGVESRYGLDPQKMQRPASVTAVYGATTYWNSGSYAYDGGGNAKTIGADYIYYDGVQRLARCSLGTRWDMGHGTYGTHGKAASHVS